MVDFTLARGRDNAPGGASLRGTSHQPWHRREGWHQGWQPLKNPQDPAQDRNLQTSPESSILGFGSVRSIPGAVLCYGALCS